ncbi:unnamed protein product [Ceratitis capitata]|uniref:(Mediterranean fruit fly) hypothetical protein n=1 Tax=Ceratitis capitata TaxID=7213 RepID=A0A811U8B2_CERCA|nr:unnamed protein product [Ceratitis capitata]
MAGVPPIPPLLCNTPPPIDFGDEDDDSGLPPTLTLDEDEFGEFALGVDINEDAMNVEASSLPRTPLPFELSSSTTSGFTDVAHTLEDCGAISISPPELSISPTHEEDKTKVQLNEAFNYNVIQKCSTDTDAIQFNDTVNKLIEKNGNPNIKDTASTLSQVADNNKYSNDSNDAKIATATAVVQIEHETEKLPEVQEFEKESSKAVQDQDIQIKPNIEPVISQTPPPPLTGLVQLEDLTDDSSDEDCHRSPKKTSVSPISPTASNEDSNSDDFFAIHIVDEPTSPKQDKLSPIAEDINMNNSSKQNNNIVNDVENEKNSNLTVVEQQSDDDDFGDFADFESATDFINPATTSEFSTTDFVDNNRNIKVEETPRDNNTPINDIDVDFDDFDDFQDFTTAPISKPSTAPATSEPKTLNNTAKNEIETNCAISATDSSVTHIEREAKPFENIDNADDDDDFGDFEEATFAATSNAQTPLTPILQTQTPLTANGNINERLGTVLKMMFPVEDEGLGDETQNKIKINLTKELPNLQSPNSKLPFEAIEAAKALEFQWPQSEMRHALIRSIGIDSRNILFGDNWNPSMPRFAANLSFNPLKPMKPQSANNTTPATYTDVDTMSYGGSGSSNNANAIDSDMSSYAKPTDVPDVEFDWQGAGFVNPLDGVKGEANTRETEAIHPSSPTTRLDTPDDQHQSDTTYTNIDDNISETLSKNERQNELRASPTRDTCPSPITLDNAAYQFAIQDQQGINMNVASNSGSSSAASSISNIKSYDNSKNITALRLGANVIVADDDDDDETVVTSTYAGPLKETHIYTPSKTELAATSKAGKSPVVANEPIDFDYEIAAAGIIIDEKVVKKEYRDVEYNPGFSLDVVNEYGGELKTESFGVVSSISALPLTPAQTQQQQPPTVSDFDTDEFTEFTEFQSVPPPSAVHAAMPTTDATYGHTIPTSTITSKFPVEQNTKTTLNSLPPVLPAAVTKAKEVSNTPSRTNSPSTIDNMILSPAILLPQAIPMNSSNATTATKAAPTIEWGNSTANINPDELARIEEFYSQPKISSAGKDAVNSSQKSTPTHAYAESQAKSSTISISASVALKEQDSTLNDDYWSEFVSVPVAPSQLLNNASRLNNNNNAGSSSNNNNNNKNNNNNNQSIMLSKRMGICTSATAIMQCVRHVITINSSSNNSTTTLIAR